MKYDLSIIIPVYNGEQYICRCIDSILKNNVNLEVIVVNDGSTDNTLDVLKKYKEIKVISQINSGVSVSRNRGLQEVQGKYFTFVDADDYVDSSMYEKMLDKAFLYNLDICGCNYYEIYRDKMKSKYVYSNTLLLEDTIIKKALNDEISLVVWDKIYKTQVFKNIFFNDNLKINEDYLFSLNCLIKSKRALFINEYLYNYCKHSNSLTTTYQCDYIKNNNYIKYLDKAISRYKEYDFFINNNELKQLHRYSMCKDKTNRYKYLNKYVDKYKLKELLRYDIGKGRKLEIIIYLISIRIHLLLFPLYVKIRNKS